jgi:hypothetical protein
MDSVNQNPDRILSDSIFLPYQFLEKHRNLTKSPPILNSGIIQFYYEFDWRKGLVVTPQWDEDW